MPRSVSEIPQEIREYAEDPAAFSPVPPGFERIDTDRYSIFLGSWKGLTSVQRLRLAPDEVEPTFHEIRQLIADREHVDTVWWVGSSATPRNITERLLALGLRPAGPPRHEPRATAMAITGAPDVGELGVEAHEIETLDDFVEGMRVQHEVFGVSEAQRREDEEGAAERFERQRADGGARSFLALVDGKPAATAFCVFTERGGTLIGGSTLPWARGRGAYKALVKARWDAAVARATPALVVHAGEMSRPILERVGFVGVATLDVLIGDDQR